MRDQPVAKGIFKQSKQAGCRCCAERKASLVSELRLRNDVGGEDRGNPSN